MRTHNWLMAACLIGAMACPKGLLAEKITVDPNAPGAQAATEAQPEQTDARLAQKVTYEATRKNVSAILEQLSTKTGVSLHSGFNKFDWQVRDRKMNIYSKDATLAGLMNSVARVMKFKWSKEKAKDGKYIYRLYMDRKSLLDEEAQRAREEERLAKLESDKRQKSLDSLTALADLSPADLAKLRKDNPFLYLLASTGLAKPLSGFFGEVPAVTQALAAGQAMDMPASSLSPQGKKLMTDALRSLWKLKSMAEGGSEAFPEEMSGMLDQATIRVNPNLEQMRQMQEISGTSFMLGELQVRVVGGMPDLEIPLFDPDSNLAKVIGEMLVSAEESGTSLKDENQSGMQEKFMAAYSSDIARDKPAEVKPERPDDPSLHKKVTIKPKSDGLPDVESALASASGLAVVSDSFARSFGLPVPKGQEMELTNLLEKVGTSFRYNWDKRGSVIEFRDKEWYKKRATQIPEAWLDEWRKTLKETGTLSLGDLARICGLTFEQFNENIMEDPVLTNGGLPETFYSSHEVLALYGMLSEAQRAEAFTESGLDSRSLTPEQLAQLDKLVRPKNAKFVESIDAGLTIKGIQNPNKNGKTQYEFTISGAGDEEPLSWTVTAPAYVEPQKPKEQKQDKPEEKEPEAK